MRARQHGKAFAWQQVARHQGEIMKVLQERFGSAAIDTARVQFDMAPSGLFLGVSIDGERVFDAPSALEMAAATGDLLAHGVSAVWINEWGDLERLPHTEIFPRKPKKKGAGL